MLSNLIRVFDIVSSILTVLCLYLVTKTYKAWIIYAFSCALFTIVCGYNSFSFLDGRLRLVENAVPGLTAMGVTLFIIGIRNYILGKRKESENG